jgi:glycosyltransferase involved in cell wall biosynthesis
MAGPDQMGWVAELKALAQRLGITDRVTWPGMLKGEGKWGAFYSAEVFALPSHQENFGIAVAEALGCGLPVLISDKVNIWREVLSSNAGFVAPDNELGTLQLLSQWLSLAPERRVEMRANALRLFDAKFTVDAMAQELLDVVAGACLGEPASTV